jgi:Fe2+ transport system protein FeoA
VGVTDANPEAVEIFLEQVALGGQARVVRLEGDQSLVGRLTSLGFWPDTLVRMVRRSPFGDPLQVSLRGYELALRRNEAHTVVVTVVSS